MSDQAPAHRTAGWRIRYGRVEDLTALPAIEVDAGRRFRSVGLDRVADDAPPDPAELREDLDSGRLWVAEPVPDRTPAPGHHTHPAGVGPLGHDTGPVGYAVAHEVDGTGHLHQVSVVEAAQGQGIGRALVARVERWARGRDFTAVTLTTYRDVAWNGPWYRSLGYRPLADDELGPDLARIREAERAAGLDLRPRVAMIRDLTAG